MNDRERLIDLLARATMHCEKICSKYDDCDMCPAGKDAFRCKHGIVADRLLASGATFATDNNDSYKWIPVTERLPEAFVSVLVQMPGEKPLPTVREGFISNDGVWHSAYFDREPDEVTHWMPMPEPPEE